MRICRKDTDNILVQSNIKIKRYIK